jgi:hypothetical protein
VLDGFGDLRWCRGEAVLFETEKCVVDREDAVARLRALVEAVYHEMDLLPVHPKAPVGRLSSPSGDSGPGTADAVTLCKAQLKSDEPMPPMHAGRIDKLEEILEREQQWPSR